MAGPSTALPWLLALVVAASPVQAAGGQTVADGQAPQAIEATADSAAAPAAPLAWPAPEAAAEGAPEVSLAGLLVKVGLGLSFVVGLAWGCVFLLKRSAVGQQLAPSGGGIRVLERSFLAPKRAIYLVEVGDRTLALGVTEQSINVLSRWPAGQLQLPERKLPGSSFAAQFRSFLNRTDEHGTGRRAPGQEVSA